jgi:hypothetical protein
VSERLHPADLQQLADLLAPRIAEELAARAHPSQPSRAESTLVSAATLAERLGVERSWVYEHAADLGGRRLGRGSKPPLRFNVETALAALPSCSAGRMPATSPGRSAEPNQRARRRPRSGTGADLLPIEGSAR